MDIIVQDVTLNYLDINLLGKYFIRPSSYNVSC